MFLGVVRRVPATIGRDRPAMWLEIALPSPNLLTHVLQFTCWKLQSGQTFSVGSACLFSHGAFRP
jgi:hypothetical protein